jgi:hypothetical protein
VSRYVRLAVLMAVTLQSSALAQQGSPIPGRSSAPIPGSGVQMTTAAGTLPTGSSGAPTASPGKSPYRQLPLSPQDAKTRIDELRAQLVNGRPQDVQDRIYEMCEWLTDAADAHYKMYLAFAKSDLTKGQAQAEKSLNQRFGQLKREAQLLKADLLIKCNRSPEALSPLVEIVIADPRSAVGQSAYKRLVDMGFSQEVDESLVAANKPTK